MIRNSSRMTVSTPVQLAADLTAAAAGVYTADDFFPPAVDILVMAARAAAAYLEAIPGTVQLVGIAGSAYDEQPQLVRAAFADAEQARQWADEFNMTVPWTRERKTIPLAAVPFIPAGVPAPQPGTETQVAAETGDPTAK
ncbi:hypothetical protein [Nocardia asiatica]|uniref:hypothetical protein n=1 Tax=Nocardia asiatica TaxID=209252 RepID=UPI0002EA01A5|nr:hypothetical protein [Nocardia asiatica]